MVLAISLVIISLLTLRQVTSVLLVILLRSARASQGKKSFYKDLRLLIIITCGLQFACSLQGQQVQVFYQTSHLFLYLSYYGPKALIVGDGQVSSIFIYKLSPVVSCFFFQGILQLVSCVFILSLIFRIIATYIFPSYLLLASYKNRALYGPYILRVGAQF